MHARGSQPYVASNGTLVACNQKSAAVSIACSRLPDSRATKGLARGGEPPSPESRNANSARSGRDEFAGTDAWLGPTD
eukprot:7385467-Prymnesium_polylepis.1